MAADPKKLAWSSTLIVKITAVMVVYWVILVSLINAIVYLIVSLVTDGAIYSPISEQASDALRATVVVMTCMSAWGLLHRSGIRGNFESTEFALWLMPFKVDSSARALSRNSAAFILLVAVIVFLECLALLFYLSVWFSLDRSLEFLLVSKIVYTHFFNVISADSLAILFKLDSNFELILSSLSDRLIFWAVNIFVIANLVNLLGRILGMDIKTFAVGVLRVERNLRRQNDLQTSAIQAGAGEPSSQPARVEPSDPTPKQP